MRTIILVLAICFAVPAMAGDKCDALAPDPARDIDQRFKGEIEGKVKGIISRIAGAAAKIEGEYKRLEKDTLKDYPDSHKLYVWQKIIYLACIQPGRIDINRLLELYMNPPVKGDGRASRDDKDRVIATVRAMEWVESNCGRHIKLVIHIGLAEKQIWPDASLPKRSTHLESNQAHCRSICRASLLKTANSASTSSTVGYGHRARRKDACSLLYRHT